MGDVPAYLDPLPPRLVDFILRRALFRFRISAGEQTMECPKCQHENHSTAKFCGECATPLPVTCPNCGSVNPLENKFCNECAQDLSQAEVTVSPPSTSASTAPEGERRQATCMVANPVTLAELKA